MFHLLFGSGAAGGHDAVIDAEAVVCAVVVGVAGYGDDVEVQYVFTGVADYHGDGIGGCFRGWKATSLFSYSCFYSFFLKTFLFGL